MAIIVLNNIKSVRIPSVVPVLIPIFVLLLMILFEKNGLESYYDTEQYLLEKYWSELTEYLTVSQIKGIGFYVTILGSIASELSNILSLRKGKPALEPDANLHLGSDQIRQSSSAES